MPITSILKVDDPSCIWGQLYSGPGGDTEAVEQYDLLMAQMNLFYGDTTQDPGKLRAASLGDGQVCVVYWSATGSWCRALVESIAHDSVSRKARCFLVDHGERLIVSSDQIRVAMENFLQLPFLVKKFHLAKIKPTTLRVSFLEKAKLIPSAQWDSSATLYLHNLLQVSTQTEAVMLEHELESIPIMLYVTVRNIKICVNDDLVTKKFALYDGEAADGAWQDECPVTSSCGVLTQMASRTPSAATAPPASATSRSRAAAADRPPATPQSRPRRLQVSEERRRSPDSQSESGSDAAAKTDSSEETSLAAALTESLSLVRLRKFLNPGSSCSVGRHEELRDSGPEGRTAASAGQEVAGSERLSESSQEDEGTSSRSGEAAPAEKTEQDRLCLRLLEWLNPDSQNPDPDAPDDTVVPGDPGRTGVLVHSALPVERCSGLDDAPLVDSLRRALRRKRYDGLSPADRHGWPALARGLNTVIISHGADRPISYLAPILTHILLNSIFALHTSSAGPIAALLCPGWETAQAVYDLLEEMNVGPALRPVIVLLGVGEDEAKAVRIPKNCLLLVTTPFSLVRLLSCQCFLFLRLYHLVLDRADQLFALAPEQMATILLHFQKVTSSEEKVSCPQQLVAVAKRWTSDMDRLLANHMPQPCIVVTVPEEVALYADVQQVVLMTLESSKISVLLGTLDLNPDVGQKTLIITDSAQEAEDVFKAVSSKSAFCLMIHEKSTLKLDFVLQQWRKDVGAGTHVFLVTTGDCLKCLRIRDATCVVHYGFPSSPRVFGHRLFCMTENLRNLSERASVQVQTGPRLTRSVLLISEKNAAHGVGLLRYMERTNAMLPPELLSFVQGVLVAHEDQKTDRPLCRYLKSFGVCRDSGVCPDRHRLVPHLDRSLLPVSGLITVVPLYVKAASVFYGRVVSNEDSGFQNVAAEMTSYYADKKPGALEVQEGGLYAVQEEQEFHRVKVLSVPDRRDQLFFSVLVRFIDVGIEKEVKSYQILQLPDRFRSLPGQAVEIVVCRVKPVDGETDWHPKVTRAISQTIQGVTHQARAVFSLGDTVFVDPMVNVSRVPGMKTVINKYNVRSLILNTGMAVSNPEHLDLLRALCQEQDHLSGSGEGPTSPQVRIKAEEDVLVEAFGAAEVSGLDDPPPLEPCEQLGPVPAVIRPVVPAPPGQQTMCEEESVSASGRRSGRTAEQMMRNGDEGDPAAPSPGENANGRSGGQQVVDTVADSQNATKSFHPQVCWYQTRDSVIVTVKLRDPQSQRCDFYPDRVVYSGQVNGRNYRTDLELEGSISAERCCWEMKSSEPVLKLVKQQQGFWERLLRNKSIFVSYDMDHIEEEETRTRDGVRFVGDTGEENWYLDSESGSESD